MFRSFKTIKKYGFIITCRVIKATMGLITALVPKDSKMIFFTSYNGKAYSDNPRTLYEYMLNDNRFQNYQFVWAVKDREKVPSDGRVKVVRYRTINYICYLIRSKYWICNSKLPMYLAKSKKQIYLQTWHGTPLKRLGHDIIAPEGATFYRSCMSYEDMCRTYDVDVSQYNYMISPNKFTTEVFQSAFAINKERLIETGYPRNDCLSTFSAEGAKALREKYGIPVDKKVLLYAPTWRDNSFEQAGYTFQLKVDFAKWKEVLGNEYVVIFKPHYLIVNNFDLEEFKGFVYSVEATADISELYIISDVLVTDYSSVFFDFAILNRPIYFYMFDLDTYKNELRGFYIDIYTDLPGDIFQNEKELLDEIAKDTYDVKRLEAFNEGFNNMEDGNATKRVIDIVFKDSK